VLQLGLRPSVVLGDLDSVSEAALRQAESEGVRVVRHPAEKDATDLELALDEAVALGARRVLVVASAGGRLDHLVSSTLLLAAPAYADVEVDALVGEALLHVVRDVRVLAGAPGELLTLVAVGGAAEGVVTEGLAYPLRGETLQPGSSRGVSNVFAASEARVTVERGVVLAIRPDGLKEEALC
jgi:thiamine pyrophosphokinase